VLAAGAIAAIVTIAWLVVSVGLVALTRHRAASAADLSALAAAAHASSEAVAACERARWVTERMRVTLSRCEVEGEEALVEVTARPPGFLGELGTAAVSARAGPSNDARATANTPDSP
jgi:secretion/DNA translocation related TadE-like protein